jgi:hypothetical protein
MTGDCSALNRKHSINTIHERLDQRDWLLFRRNQSITEPDFPYTIHQLIVK